MRVRPEDRTTEDAGPTGRGPALGLLLVALVVVAVAIPVVIRGAPLADDFTNCVRPQRVGLGSSLATSVERLGALRPVHLLEVVLTTGVCRALPFGVAIAVPLALTLAVALLLRGLLRDLGTPAPWPEVGAGIWLLHPLGTEAALWPAALHIPLGLALALGALRLHRAGRHGWAALAVVGAGLSVEQALLALPLAAWLVARPEGRRRALVTTMIPVVLLLAAFVVLPGQDPRLQVSLADRVVGVFRDPAFYVQFPAVGLGLHSIPLAMAWSFPVSVALLAGGAALGAWAGPKALPTAAGLPDGGFLGRVVAAGLGLMVLVNVPVAMVIPRQGSPRLFTPTWLVLAAIVALVGARVGFRRRVVVGAAAGVLAAGAVLSLAFSVDVRLRSADVVEAASRRIAAATEDGDVVAVCGIRRTVTEPAPRGAYAVHDLIYEWAARDALEYHTGRRASFVLAGELWDDPCPSPEEVDHTVRFPDLLKEGS
jgi:hypothetical protein